MLTTFKNCARSTAALSYYLKKHEINISDVIHGAVAFANNNNVGSCAYRFSYSASKETLFSSVYAMLIYGLAGTEISDKCVWKEYFDAFQGDDGIWRDSNNPFRNWEQRDDEWNDIHIIPHIIYGYELLDDIPKMNFKFLDKFQDIKYVREFCDKINFDMFWGESNGVMNYLVSMMYARDVMGNKEIGQAIDYIIGFLKKRMDDTDGIWTKKKDKKSLYEAVRGGYHVWMLMIQEKVEFDQIQIKNIIDCILSLQNKLGGFDEHIISDTCHNIDCIDPLARFSLMLPQYRKNEVEATLRKARNYLLCNRNLDGGFCFSRMCKFKYGNDLHVSKRNESNMFATWFSLLALSIIEDFFSRDVILTSSLPGMEYHIK